MEVAVIVVMHDGGRCLLDGLVGGGSFGRGNPRLQEIIHPSSLTQEAVSAVASSRLQVHKQPGEVFIA